MRGDALLSNATSLEYLVVSICVLRATEVLDTEDCIED
jgi:hypothetical protein